MIPLEIFVVVYAGTHEFIKAFATRWAANTYIAGLDPEKGGYFVIESELGAWHSD